MPRSLFPLVLSVPFALLLLLAPAPAAPPDPAAIPPLHRPAADKVARYGPAYRFPQAGWVVLHVEGEPYERGYQQGRLLAKEVAAYVRMLATECSAKAPADGWKAARRLAAALFLRQIDDECLEEMKGIAEGAADAGARYDDRDIDLVDVVVLNTWMEIATLDAALEATGSGLEERAFPRPLAPRAPAPRAVQKDHCSAFIAAGPATADGKIVMGHITMAGLTAGPFVNYWIDVRPKKGHRFVMQAFPGAVWSSQDYYINEKGVVLCETTIDQTPFDPAGRSLVGRARKAIQYGDGIDDVVKHLREKNNGLYANEWLIGDLNTNEIAMLELGTRTSRLWRSSRNEWFQNTKGFYWGCNNAKDDAVRREARPADPAKRPKESGWQPDDRDKAWLKFYESHKGKIGADAARKILTNETLAAPTSLDAKYTTADLAARLASHAMYGPPSGRVWEPTVEERRNHPEIETLKPHPWTVLTIDPPPK